MLILSLIPLSIFLFGLREVSSLYCHDCGAMPEGSTIESTSSCTATTCDKGACYKTTALKKDESQGIDAGCGKIFDNKTLTAFNLVGVPVDQNGCIVIPANYQIPKAVQDSIKGIVSITAYCQCASDKCNGGSLEPWKKGSNAIGNGLYQLLLIPIMSIIFAQYRQ